MLKLLVVADDFTGALDTGVQFSKLGISTLVTTDLKFFEKPLDKNIEVLVIDTESRYLTAEKAYQQMKAIVEKAKKLMIPYIYKKVDSALRGNISSEIKGILDASQVRAIPFLPAYPEMERVLKDGSLYINQVLVSESIFADDPYEPVTQSHVPTRLKVEANIDSSLIKDGQLPENSQGLLIFDAETDAELKEHLQTLKQADLLKISIGCAGFAKLLAEELFSEKNPIQIILEKPLVVISGSVNPITKKQIEYAEEKNYPRISLTAEQLLQENYWQTIDGQKDILNYQTLMKEKELIVFETLNEKTSQAVAKLEAEAENDIRFRIGTSLGKLTEALWQGSDKGTFLFTGGDTLFQSMEVLGIKEIRPLAEISAGVVLSTIVWQQKELQVITKSGGFGHQELFEELAIFTNYKEEEKCS